MKKNLMMLAAVVCCTLASSKVNAWNIVPAVTRSKVLTKEELTACEKSLLVEWKDSVKAALQTVYRDQVLRIDTLSMPLHWTVYDEKPTDGYALYISLHGGGGAPSHVNDNQWENQKKLYRPKNAVYLCPRAIKDTWNMHFLPETDEFYRRIIMMAEAYLDVNPNKVYVMGYSAGGDGIWRKVNTPMSYAS